jgi:hypothetical protein
VKILFDKIAKNSVITSEQEDASFPASNLVHQFARVYYKSTSFDDVITIMFDDQREVSSFFFTFSNAVSMTVRLYKWDATLLETIDVDCSYDAGAEYFDAVNARWATITAESNVSNDLIIGAVEFGMETDYPLPTANFVPMFESKSTMDESDQGQVSFQYVEPRYKYIMKYQAVPKSDYLTLLELFRRVDRGHIWIDITEEDHSVYRPLYCVTNIIEGGERNDDLVSFNITFTEAR